MTNKIVNMPATPEAQSGARGERPVKHRLPSIVFMGSSGYRNEEAPITPATIRPRSYSLAGDLIPPGPSASPIRLREPDAYAKNCSPVYQGSDKQHKEELGFSVREIALGVQMYRTIYETAAAIMHTRYMWVSIPTIAISGFLNVPFITSIMSQDQSLSITSAVVICFFIFVLQVLTGIQSVMEYNRKHVEFTSKAAELDEIYFNAMSVVETSTAALPKSREEMIRDIKCACERVFADQIPLPVSMKGMFDDSMKYLASKSRVPSYDEGDSDFLSLLFEDGRVYAEPAKCMYKWARDDVSRSYGTPLDIIMEEEKRGSVSTAKTSSNATPPSTLSKKSSAKRFRVHHGDRLRDFIEHTRTETRGPDDTDAADDDATHFTDEDGDDNPETVRTGEPVDGGGSLGGSMSGFSTGTFREKPRRPRAPRPGPPPGPGPAAVPTPPAVLLPSRPSEDRSRIPQEGLFVGRRRDGAWTGEKISGSLAEKPSVGSSNPTEFGAFDTKEDDMVPGEAQKYKWTPEDRVRAIRRSTDAREKRSHHIRASAIFIRKHCVLAIVIVVITALQTALASVSTTMRVMSVAEDTGPEFSSGVPVAQTLGVLNGVINIVITALQTIQTFVAWKRVALKHRADASAYSNFVCSMYDVLVPTDMLSAPPMMLERAMSNQWSNLQKTECRKWPLGQMENIHDLLGASLVQTRSRFNKSMKRFTVGA